MIPATALHPIIAMESWLNTLNVLDSPTEVSPATGPNETDRTAESLSHPIAHQDLFDQLQQWTNVDFNFNDAQQQQPESISLTSTHPGSQHPYSGVFDSAQSRLGSIKGKSYEKGFSAAPTSTFIDPNAVFAPVIDPALFGNDFSLPSTSFQPYPAALPYPNFPAFDQPAQVEAPLNSEPVTSSKATKTKAPKKGKKVSTPAVAAAAPVEQSAETTPDSTTSPEDGQVPEVDDKRRRNTLASGLSDRFALEILSYLDVGQTARFRVKKKEREQALAKNAKELQDKVAVLEKEVDLLKKENGWLRGLIVEKAKVRFDVFLCPDRADAGDYLTAQHEQCSDRRAV